MTSFAVWPVFSFVLLELWAFLLIVFGSVNTSFAVFLKKYTYAIEGAVTFALAYFVWQVVFDLHSMRFGGEKTVSHVTEKLVQLPWVVWVCVLFLLSLAAAALFVCNIRYRSQRVSPVAVKLCADRMFSGICYWRESGRVVLSNLCMDRLCIALTGQPLLNGRSFYDVLPNDVVSEGGRAWRFTYREMQLDGEPIFELIASDITEEHSKTKALKKDAESLSRMKQELQDYQAGIKESVRRQEILQAKINIHDEMNRLMLSTVTVDSGKPSELNAVLSLWERNALLLCMEADDGGKELKKIEQTAQLLNLRLVQLGTLPTSLTNSQQELLYSAAQEAIVNAVKHAEASTLTLSFAETEAQICCIFENDGTVTHGAVRFTGGLANLDLLARKQGAEITAEAGDTFTLTLTFLKKT